MNIYKYIYIVVYSSELFPKPVLTLFFSQLDITGSRPPFFFLGLFLFSPSLRLLGPLQAQNTQQTGFKGNLRLLVKTLEQPHLPFKILPAALSHCFHSDWCIQLPLLSPATLYRSRGRTQCWGYISLSSYLFTLEDIFKKEWQAEWEEASVQLCVNIWSGFAFVYAGFF